MPASHTQPQEVAICDLGLTLGIAAGIANAAGQASAAAANSKNIQQRYNLAQVSNEHDFVTKANAANKEGYQATLEGDRAKSSAIASGAGMNGNTAGLRLAEQSRQQALSIANAKDQREGAKANYIMQGKADQLGAQDALNKQQMNPMTTFLDVATSGLKNYGAFQ
ncbi:MAG: hypothetical protein EOR11_22700 [Mesorhizobium sp.]|uniref:hypothetical protein n=1 Tax=Mesorhizobium sp. TaxID=1871066 RepID=UPI000FE74C5A|nr:hypothetical protein [Mesorhizobium sp.]RWP83795.1 MAG: hypothetical protein EOR11_22700 [Mesorhizobium sp.]